MSDAGTLLTTGLVSRSDANQRSLSAGRIELAHERAVSLGLASKDLRTTLAALAAYDRGARGRKGRARLLEEAARACMAFLVQREAMGLDTQDAQALCREYSIPTDVWNAMGSR